MASATFARLVRVAPLVTVTASSDDDDDDQCLSSSSNTSTTMRYNQSDCCRRRRRRRQASDKVIDHLIHGKPLPPCTLPTKLQTSLKDNGISLRHYHYLNSCSIEWCTL